MPSHGSGPVAFVVAAVYHLGGEGEAAQGFLEGGSCAHFDVGIMLEVGKDWAGEGERVSFAEE